MRTEKAIDYIQFSMEDFQYATVDKPERTISPIRFYTHCIVYPQTGIRVLSGNPNSKKQLVVMSGTACNKFGQSNLKQFIEYQLSQGATVSRIDLCVTSDCAEHIEMTKDALASGVVTSKRLDIERSKVIGRVDDTPETIYIGDVKKRGRKGIMRVYDKAVELGVDMPMTRFELECKGSVANNNAKRWVNGVDIGNMIRASVDCSRKWWIDVMGKNDPLPQVNAPDKDSYEDEIARRWQWLCEQVAPALGKAIAKDESMGLGYGNFDRFNDIVSKNYRANIS